MGHVIRQFTPADTEAVVAVWESCGLVRPWNDPRRDIARKLTVQPELFLVATEAPSADAEPADADPADADPADADPAGDGPTVVAAGMAGFDGHRGWVNYLAVRPDLQGSGLGRAFMAEFERLLTDLGCPKLNLQVRAGNEQVIGFYESLGYTDDHTVSMGKRLIPDA
ncbi:GNAT family N-acetyltransferase [Curtobacterium sp. VKM Ac-1395]|uniref:GNAT family N-acetyltransferase n=1 Tax=Curtobacterium sp. VKM Ac-1395 TaxID=2783815 RepID=UPI00188B1C1F|nr:GNAT family N-acetyltransferase [Curtobacterium sp. VKM Ac-1395]MBF4589371.1 GNAT family N-acetyltransferase [Curtobacterium sp. VKM Ac-1395]